MERARDYMGGARGKGQGTKGDMERGKGKGVREYMEGAREYMEKARGKGQGAT